MTIKFTTQPQNARILSVGAYRPARVVPNSELVERIDSSDEWIQQRTGIESRRVATPEESLIDMATHCSLQAIERAGLQTSDIDAVIFATISYPYQAPSAATDLLTRLNNSTAAAFDISAACAGFCYSVALANDMVRSRNAKNVLVVGAEKLSDFTDPNDRATAFIFADGAGAVVIGPSDEVGIGPTIWGANSQTRDAILLEPSYLAYKADPGNANLGWPNINQQGQTVFRWAVYEIAPIALRALEAAGMTPDDLDVFIPHQANDRIIDSLVKSMRLPDSVVVARDIRTSGNTSSASIPLAMDALLKSRPDLHGKSALLVGFGAGLVYAGQVVELPPKPKQ